MFLPFYPLPDQTTITPHLYYLLHIPIPLSHHLSHTEPFSLYPIFPFLYVDIYN